MRFDWIRDRVHQGQFTIFWIKGNTNRANYFSKHHAASHHQAIRSMYLYSPTNPARHYFEFLTDTGPAPSPAAPCANSLTILSMDPGEGVLLTPSDVIRCHCQGPTKIIAHNLCPRSPSEPQAPSLSHLNNAHAPMSYRRLQ